MIAEMPCPTPTHMVQRALFVWRRSSSRVAVNTSRAPLMPRGCPSAIAPPFGFICSRILRQTKIPEYRNRLRGEGLVELDDIDIPDTYVQLR